MCTKSFGFTLLALALGACSAQPPASKVSTRPTGAAIAFQAELRVLGSGASPYTALLFEARDVVVTANGVALAVTPGQTHLDLTDASQAWLLGTFGVPVGVDKVHVALRLDDFGGYEKPGAAGAIDARTAPIEFDAPVASLAERKHAVAILDLTRSLVPRASGTVALVPQLQIAY